MNLDELTIDRFGNFFRENWLRIIIGVIFTVFMVRMGNMNMIWMLLVVLIFKL